MGWLRDLMASAEPRVPSYGKLAGALQKLPDWPASSALQTRSLATLLSRLDRGQDLSWLADREPVQLALGRVLGVPLDEVRRASGAQRAEAADARLLRLRDLPTARPLDLSSEELPPGLPLAVLQQAEEPLWWVCAPAAGRGLAARWLQARGRTKVLATPLAAEVDALSGPLFVEFDGSFAEIPRARPGLCVAARFAPPKSLGFREVRSPPLASVLEALLGWVSERLPVKTRFEPVAARALLSERLENGTLQTLGEALGLVGLLDEFGTRELLARSPARTAQRIVESRVQRTLDPSAPFASWVRRSIYAALLGIAERTLVDSELPLSAPRSFEQWLALVPPELERNVDLDWMRLSLAQIDSAIRPADVERAARRLPPGAFRVVTSLIDARLLRKDATGRLRLEPAWLLSELARSAEASLLGRSPFEWGEALLRPHAASGLAEALLEQTLRDGGAGLEAVLELEAEDQPGYAAAVDLAFRTAGIARLLGADIGQEVLEGLWRENALLALDQPGELPLPRLDFAHEPALDGGSGTKGQLARVLLSDGGYYLAALCISELLESKGRSDLALLDPWHHSAPDARLGLAYDKIASTFRGDPRFWQPVIQLVARVRAVVGNVLGAETPHELELPAQILDEVEHGVLAFTTLEQAEAESWLGPVLLLADAHGTSRMEVARAIWDAWEQAGRPDGATFLAPRAGESTLFWGTIPGPLLASLLVDARRQHVPYPAFGDEQWRAFAEALRRYPELVSESAAWLSMPSEWVGNLLTLPLDWASAPDSVSVLWQRFPELLTRAVQRQLAASPHDDVIALGALLRGAPNALASELLRELGPRVYGLGPGAQHAIRALLRRQVAERGESWREAYASLSKLEREWRSIS